MGKIAFIFPGQGSQTVGMGKVISGNLSIYRDKYLIKQMQKLGYSLSKLIFEGPQEELTITTNAQPALLTTSIAILRIF